MHFLEKLHTQPIASDGKVFADYVVAHEYEQLQAELAELRATVAQLRQQTDKVSPVADAIIIDHNSQ